MLKGKPEGFPVAIRQWRRWFSALLRLDETKSKFSSLTKTKKTLVSFHLDEARQAMSFFRSGKPFAPFTIGAKCDRRTEICSN